MWRVVGGHHPVESNSLCRFASRQRDDAVVAPFAFLVETGGEPAGLGGVARDLEGAALDDARVDVLAFGDLDDLVHGVVERALPGHHAVAPVLLGHRVAVAGHQSGQPATVAPGRAEAREPRFEHDDPQRRIRPLQVVRRPQSGVAGADDADVCVAVARQLGAWRRVRVEPVGDLTVDRSGLRGHRQILALTPLVVQSGHDEPGPPRQRFRVDPRRGREPFPPRSTDGHQRRAGRGRCRRRTEGRGHHWRRQVLLERSRPRLHGRESRMRQNRICTTCTRCSRGC